MPDEITFLDLLALEKITGNTVVEKFGSLINSSFFDAQNILGTLKVKGLIDFTTMVPGQNAITVTDAGKQLIADAASKAQTQFDQLDLSMLTQLSGGKRTLVDLAGVTNIRPRDLAMHLNKLVEQQYITADIRNGSVNMMLTEKGFIQVKTGMPVQAPATPMAAMPQQGAPSPSPAQAQQVQPMAAPVQPMATQSAQAQDLSMQQMQAQETQPQPGNGIAELQKEIKASKLKRSKKLTILVAVIVIIVIFVVLLQRGII